MLAVEDFPSLFIEKDITLIVATKQSDSIIGVEHTFRTDFLPFQKECLTPNSPWFTSHSTKTEKNCQKCPNMTHSFFSSPLSKKKKKNEATNLCDYFFNRITFYLE